jgi:hypothetical protein
MTPTVTFKNKVKTYTFTGDVIDGTSIGIDYYVVNQEYPLYQSATAEVECKKHAGETKEYACEAGCDETKEPAPRTCSKAERDAGRDQCCAILPVVPPEAPALAKKTLPRPVFLGDVLPGGGGRCVNRNTDNTNYVGIAIWKDNHDDWAISDETPSTEVPGSPKKANDWLSLCVSQDLIRKYVEPIKLIVTGNDNDPCPKPEYELKGWITNSLDPWSQVGNTFLSNSNYLHICVKKISELGDYVYLSTTDRDGQYCKDNTHKTKGRFRFIQLGGSFWDFAGAYDSNTGEFKDIVVSGGAVNEGWVGLCVKPVQI